MDGKPGPWQVAAGVLASLLTVGVAVWAEMPPWQRELIICRSRSAVRRAAGVLAARCGMRAMKDELGGRAAEADAGYRFTERLSRLRDLL